MELSKETRNHGLNRLQEARLSVDNGAGENDLKRLQRKFQATKATYINVDVKERFMSSEWRRQGCPGPRAVRDSCVAVRRRRRAAPPPALGPAGLRAGTLDVTTLEDAHRGLEEQLQRDSEALRGLKDQNAAARGALQETSASIATLHQQFEQVGVERARTQGRARAPPQQHRHSRPRQRPRYKSEYTGCRPRSRPSPPTAGHAAPTPPSTTHAHDPRPPRQVMGDVAAQLDAIERSLQQFEATRPPPIEPLEDGPDQVGLMACVLGA